MTVKEYYYEHFDELEPKKQFHFATRMKNYFGVHDFDEFLKNNQPDTNLVHVFENNDYSKVHNFTERKPFFEKYSGLYGIEAALFRVHHLLKEYNLDKRNDFLRLYSKEKLYKLADNLLRDEEALKVLSSWAINTIYLTEELFPRGNNAVGLLAGWALNTDFGDLDPTLSVYLYTHIVICASGFYTNNLRNSEDFDRLKGLIKKADDLVMKNIETISLDACVEFLVCCNMLDVNYKNTRNKINLICNEFRKDQPYLVNYRRNRKSGSYFCSLNGAEHINALYIMSGLDH